MKILVVDDDRELVDLLTFVLQRAGFEALAAFDPAMALRRLENRPDLAILDVHLGTADGFELLQALRRRTQIPIVMLTARRSEMDKVRGLELGADDYLTKPFGHRELVARIEANLRRAGQQWDAPAPAPAPVEVGPLWLDPTSHAASKHGQLLQLTVLEFRLLHYLMMNAATAVPTNLILRHVWGYEDPGGANLVRIAVYRLRRKIEDDPTRPALLHTVAGVGFMLKAEPA